MYSQGSTSFYNNCTRRKIRTGELKILYLILQHLKSRIPRKLNVHTTVLRVSSLPDAMTCIMCYNSARKKISLNGIAEFMHPILTTTSKPIGQITRGKTARNRLRRVDIFASLYAASLLRQPVNPGCKSWVVDLGYGAEAYTVLESAVHLGKLNPTLPLLGVEIDQERVNAGLPYQTELIQFRQGGFNVPLLAGESIRMMRAFNVLRQYEEGEVLPAWQTMAARMQPDGLILEGTSDPYGKRLVTNLLRVRVNPAGIKTLIWEGLLFSTNFHDGFNPEMFQPVLPKNLIHHMLPGEEIHRFFEDWKSAAQQQIATQSFGLRQHFCATAMALKAMGYSILTRKKLLRQGFLFWQLNRPLCTLSDRYGKE